MLCCAVLYCTVLYCTVLYCAVLHCTVLHWTALHCSALHFVAPSRLRRSPAMAINQTPSRNLYALNIKRDRSVIVCFWCLVVAHKPPKHVQGMNSKQVDSPSCLVAIHIQVPNSKRVTALSCCRVAVVSLPLCCRSVAVVDVLVVCCCRLWQAGRRRRWTFRGRGLTTSLRYCSLGQCEAYVLDEPILSLTSSLVVLRA